MLTKFVLATLAVLGSSTAALADGRFHRDNRPIVSAPQYHGREVISVTRPVVAQGRDRDRDHGRGRWGGDRERGHGPVYRQPVVITPPVYQSSGSLYQSTYQPAYDQSTYYQPTHDPSTYDQPTYDRPYQSDDGYIGTTTQGWMNLTAPLSLAGGRVAIELDGRGGAVDTLMVQADAGATSIGSIDVVFMDGTSQQFSVRQTIDMGNPELTFDVGHRQIESVIVYGQSGYGASFQILGRD